MMLATSVSVSAIETMSAGIENENTTSNFGGAAPMLNNNIDAYVQNVSVGGTGSDRAYLDSYIGIKKKFTIYMMTPDNPDNVTGYITVILRKDSNGEAVGGWTITKSQPIRESTFTLPTSGYYTMTVENHTNTRVSVEGIWS